MPLRCPSSLDQPDKPKLQTYQPPAADPAPAIEQQNDAFTQTTPKTERPDSGGADGAGTTTIYHRRTLKKTTIVYEEEEEEIIRREKRTSPVKRSNSCCKGREPRQQKGYTESP